MVTTGVIYPRLPDGDKSPIQCDPFVGLVRLLARQAAREYLQASFGRNAADKARRAKTSKRGESHGH